MIDLTNFPDLDSINIYSPGYSLLLTDIILNNFNEDVYVIFKTNYFEPVSEAASNSLFVYNLYDKNNVLVHYKTFNLKSLLDTNYGFWKSVYYTFSVHPDLQGY